jgi:exodeoxyribonuclease VIII
MLDLETMAVTPDAAIIAIGAVSFMPEKMLIMDRFHETISLESCLKTGLVINGDTVMWWMQQDASARKQFSKHGWGLKACLRQFAQWVTSDTWMWGNGASFDNVILANAYRQVKLDVPWKWWKDRCYRTIAAMHPEIKLKRIGTYHNAVDDAESQAIHLMKILNKDRDILKALANAKFGKHAKKG